MRLKEIVAEWHYIKDADNKPEISFDKQDSNVRDFYFRIAVKELPTLLGGYFGNGNKLANLIRGCILNFIDAHGNTITKQNYDSLAKRITSNIRGIILNGDKET